VLSASSMSGRGVRRRTGTDTEEIDLRDVRRAKPAPAAVNEPFAAGRSMRPPVVRGPMTLIGAPIPGADSLEVVGTRWTPRRRRRLHRLLLTVAALAAAGVVLAALLTVVLG